LLKDATTLLGVLEACAVVLSTVMGVPAAPFVR
jgi:hypothetical protein